MIVFDLKCSQNHVFEGWFGSNDDFKDQLARGLLSCPICSTNQVGKAVMAPAIGAKSNQLTQNKPAKETRDKDDKPSALNTDQTGATQNTMVEASINADASAEMKQMLSKLAKAQEKALQSSQWVGKDFAETARAMHYGEKEAAPVHGEASLNDAKDLLNEGINIAPLPLPVRRPEKEN